MLTAQIARECLSARVFSAKRLKRLRKELTLTSGVLKYFPQQKKGSEEGFNPPVRAQSSAKWGNLPKVSAAKQN